MPTSRQKMIAIVVNQEVDVVKYFYYREKSKAMNTNQKDPGCCGGDSGCCGITDFGCC